MRYYSLTEPWYIRGHIVDSTNDGVCQDMVYEEFPWTGVCAYLEIHNPGIYTFATPCDCGSERMEDADLNERVCVYKGERCADLQFAMMLPPPPSPPRGPPLPPSPPLCRRLRRRRRRPNRCHRSSRPACPRRCPWRSQPLPPPPPRHGRRRRRHRLVVRKRRSTQQACWRASRLRLVDGRAGGLIFGRSLARAAERSCRAIDTELGAPAFILKRDHARAVALPPLPQCQPPRLSCPPAPAPWPPAAP